MKIGKAVIRVEVEGVAAYEATVSVPVVFCEDPVAINMALSALPDEAFSNLVRHAVLKTVPNVVLHPNVVKELRRRLQVEVPQTPEKKS